MLEMYSTNAIVAKIRSVYGTMLTMDDFREMVAKRSVAEVADYLRHTKRYQERLRDIDPNSVHRGLFEQLLADESYSTYKRMCEFQGLEDKPFYDFLLKKSECSQMIKLVNAVDCGLQHSFVQGLPRYVMENSRIPFLTLAKCRSFEELKARLKGTGYFRLFGKFRLTGEGRVDFTDAEVKLRTSLYEQLAEDAVRSFTGREKDELLRLIRSEIDVINMINAYRLKSFFGYEPEKIKRSMLPFTQAGKKNMDKLYECADPEKMRAMIEAGPYGKYISPDDDDIELGLRRRTLYTMKHTLARSNSAPIALYAFVCICENELRNIVRAIEGVRYDVDPALIYRLLIF